VPLKGGNIQLSLGAAGNCHGRKDALDQGG
jgi:hypothetical protein